jgi:aquaporin Z
MGLAMGLTAVALIYSPWGKQSGAHLNPAVTLTFWRLGKIETWDAVFYVIAQFAGGAIGVLLVLGVVGRAFADAPVSYVATLPGTAGPAAAFVAEVAMTFLLMATVLSATNVPALARFTGLFTGGLVMLYITFEAPVSGMSLNPARSFASAAPSGLWTGYWIYIVAPLLGMLLAAQAYVTLAGAGKVSCAKLHHQNTKRCIFCLAHQRKAAAAEPPPSPAAHALQSQP